MKREDRAFTLIELLVVIAIIAILAGMLLPILARAREEARRGKCGGQLASIGKACTAYMSINGDFWPYQEDMRNIEDGYGFNVFTRDDAFGTGGYLGGHHNPCVSLSILYPRWLDNMLIFACPSTQDRPLIIKEKLRGFEFSWFAKMDSMYYGNGLMTSTLTLSYPYIRDYRAKDSWALGTGGWTDQKFNSANTDPIPDRGLMPGTYADYAKAYESETTGPGPAQRNTSYGYDDIAHYTDMLPGSVRAGDMQFEISRGETAQLPLLTQSNHKDGQNVLFWDGHVSFTSSVYCGTNPEDNIYTYDKGGGSTDAVIARTHGDPMKPRVDGLTGWCNWDPSDW